MRDTIDMAREAGIDEWWDNGGDWRETFNEHLKAFEALVRADECALATPVQEPVGYVAENGVVDWNVCAPPILTDLYTTPPAQPQRTWVGLTDEEILKSEWAIGANDVLLNFARAIEAKLKEKNT